jgi:Tfp pilus assembly protein PilF
MLSTLFTATRTRRVSLTLVCLSFALLSSIGVKAQIGGTGIDDDRASGFRQGNNTIVGQVVLPRGERPSHRITVRLSSVRIGEFSTMTDENGTFTFRRLIAGSYFITVEAGRDYLPAQQTVDLYDNLARTTTVQIELRAREVATVKPTVLNAALNDVPKPAVDHYQKGMAAAAAGDTKVAIEHFKAALEIYPRFILALNELSALYVNQNDLPNAEQSLKQALEIEPNNATLRMNYGYVLLLREKFADADRELHKAITLRDDLASAHLYRGRALIRLSKFDEAESELNRAVSFGGSAAVLAYRYLGALYSERGDNEKAVAALEKYLKAAPNAKDADQVRAVIKQLTEAANKKN